MRVRKKFWLAPIILALVLLAALFMIAGSVGVVSPFIYMMKLARTEFLKNRLCPAMVVLGLD